MRSKTTGIEKKKTIAFQTPSTVSSERITTTMSITNALLVEGSCEKAAKTK